MAIVRIRPEPPRREVMECPACGEATMPNLLADGRCVCSCPAERDLPLPGAAGQGPAR